MKQKISQYWLLFLISVVMSVLVMTERTHAQDNSPIPIIAALQTQLESLTARVDTLEAENQALKTQLACVSNTSDSNNLYFDGCDVHVRNGAGQTDSNNGKGNLIVGYNKVRLPESISDKTGSHNLVIGDMHNYTSFGGVVAGLRNTINGQWASVIGGTSNIAEGNVSSVTGGQYNSAPGGAATVGGGFINIASGGFSSVIGGFQNTASEFFSNVSGGSYNTASGAASTVSGGQLRSASGEYNWAAGSLLEPN